jgi:L-ascorbate metabolism protein UlaG (beta-lactamase superfamily)
MKKICIFIFSVSIIGLIGISCKKDNSNVSVPKVNAGSDTIVYDLDTLVLKGTSSEKTANWSILQGDSGELTNKNQVVVFKGNYNINYKLLLKSENSAGKTSDTISITFKSKVFTIDEMADRIHWIEQSCFRIEGSKYIVYTDPQAIKVKDSADLILITHPHGDHFSPTDIGKLIGPNTILIAPSDCNYSGTIARRLVLKPGESFVYKDVITIKAVPAYNIVKSNNHPKSSNWVGYLITMNGVTIYHAGDTERIPEMQTFTCDIAMLPLGQTYTMVKVDDAAESAKDVKAKIAIPMHYGLYEGKIADATTFKTLLDGTIKVIIKTKGQ